MATGLTFPTLDPCISPYGLVEVLNDFFLQIQTASTFNFDTFATNGSFNGSELTINDNQGGAFTVPWLNDLFITGGSYNHGTSLITLDNSTGDTFSFSLSAITDQLDGIVINEGNDFVTEGDFDQETGVITFTRQSGGTFTTDLSSITDDLYSLSAISSFDVTTGATFNTSTNDFTFDTFTGGTYSVNASSLSANTFVTGVDADGVVLGQPNSLIITLNDGSSAYTSLNTYTNNDYVISGTYSSGTSLLTLTTLSGDTVGVDMGELANQSVGDDYLVSGVFNSGTSVMTLTTLSGNTVEVTGVTQEDRHIFSGDVVGTSLINFYGTNGYSFVVDVTSLSTAAQAITGGVYSGDSSSLVFYASSGGTAFVVDGLSKVTGGTYDSVTENLEFSNTTGGTFSVENYIDNYITGATFSELTTDINLTDKLGNLISVHLGALTADTGVLAVQGGVNTYTGGTQQYPEINLNDTVTLSTINAGEVNTTTVNSSNVNSTNIITTNIDSINVDTINLDASIMLSAGTNLYDIFELSSSSWQDSVSNFNIVSSGDPTISGTSLYFYPEGSSDGYLAYAEAGGGGGSFVLSSETSGGFLSMNSKEIQFVNGSFPTNNMIIGVGGLVGTPFVQGHNGTANGFLSFSSMTDNRIWSLPDQSGTVALTTDITGALSSNSWQDSVSSFNIVSSGDPTISGTSLYFYPEDSSYGYLAYAEESLTDVFVLSSKTYNQKFTLSPDGSRFTSGIHPDNSMMLAVNGSGKPFVYGHNGTGYGELVFSSMTANRTWDLPDQSGTVALTTDITGALSNNSWQDSVSNFNIVSSGDPTISGTSLYFYPEDSSYGYLAYAEESFSDVFVLSSKTFNQKFSVNPNGSRFTSGFYPSNSMMLGVYTADGKPFVYGHNGTANGELVFSSMTDNRDWDLPDKSGTVALTTDITDALSNNSWQDSVSNFNTVSSGDPTISGTSLYFYPEGSSDGYLAYVEDDGGSGVFTLSSDTTGGYFSVDEKRIKFVNGSFPTRSLRMSIDANGEPSIDAHNGSYVGILSFSSMTANRGWELPDKSGTIAIQDPITPQVLVYSATTWLNTNLGHNAELTLTGDADLEIQNMAAGKSANLVIKQDGVGSHSITSLPAGSIVVDNQSGAITVTGGASAIDLFTVYYDGTNYFWNNKSNYS
jgi:hypothetical protein